MRIAQIGQGQIELSRWQTDQNAFVLAIVGLFLCGPLCLTAWVIGRRGSAGRTIGFVGTLIWLMGTIICLALAEMTRTLIWLVGTLICVTLAGVVEVAVEMYSQRRSRRSG